MAVHAQYLSSFNNNQEFLMQQHGDLFGKYYNYCGQKNFNANVLSEPESELTCNDNNIMVSGGSRKRNRDDYDSYNLEQMFYHQQIRFPNKFMKTRTENGCQAISTSGRSSENGTQDLTSHIFQQNEEMDSLILLENQRVHSGLKETHKKHCKSLLLVIEQQVLNKMQEKEKELVIARRRNQELEEKVKQMSAENQIWFNVAKNNEAMVSTLKSSLEKFLIQKQGQQKEGWGDSDSMVDDAQSSCDEDKLSRGCKVCEDNEVSVLLLPCRHLCVCRDCDFSLHTCPICHSVKNASLEVFVS